MLLPANMLGTASLVVANVAGQELVIAKDVKQKAIYTIMSDSHTYCSARGPGHSSLRFKLLLTPGQATCNVVRVRVAYAEMDSVISAAIRCVELSKRDVEGFASVAARDGWEALRVGRQRLLLVGSASDRGKVELARHHCWDGLSAGCSVSRREGRVEERSRVLSEASRHCRQVPC